jgi:hypothetical protein
MPPVITESDRKTDNRGVSPPAWATEPPVWGEPVARDPAGWEKVRRDLAEMERKKVFRYARPDGSQLEDTWVNESSAKIWAEMNGLRYLGQVPEGPVAPPPPPPPERGTRDRGTEAPLSPPPLVEAPKRRKPVPPPAKPEQTKPPPPDPKPPPKKRPPLPPAPPPEEYGIIEYLKEDFVHTTMTESMPLISKWFGRAAKVLEVIPGMQGVAKIYEGIETAADGAQLIYELAHELNQSEAFEKGGKQLVKRTKPVKKIAEKLLKKKFPNLPEPARKKAAELLEEWFEKYGTDPAIEGGRKKMQELDERKELDQTLFHELKKLLGTPPTATPTVTPAR